MSKFTEFIKKDASEAAKNLSDAVTGWALLLCVGAVLSAGYEGFRFVAPFVAPDSVWAYTMRYDTTPENVTIDRKPHDCDFDKAPLGNKECHYNRTVTTQKGDASVNYKTLVYVTWEKVQE